MASLHDADALLIYEVGPVRCCAPTGPIEQIVLPPDLTHPPGSDAARPGIFRHGQHIVSVIDLRQRFGIEPDRWQPGRLVITRLARGYTGFWVDRIVDVIRSPAEGWGGLPPHLPRDTFSRTLLYREQIHLYTEFEQLPHLHPAGFLRQYLAQLASADEPATPKAQPVSEHQPSASQPDDETGLQTTQPSTSDAGSPPEPTPAPSAPTPPSPAVEPSESRPDARPAGAKTPPAAPREPRQPAATATTARTTPDSAPTKPAAPPAQTRPTAAPVSSDRPAPQGQPKPAPAPPTAPVTQTARTAPVSATSNPAPSRPVEEETGSGLGALLVLLLLLGGGAAGVYLWYPADDIPDPVPLATLEEPPAPPVALPTPPPASVSEAAPRPATRQPASATPQQVPGSGPKPESEHEHEPEPEPESKPGLESTPASATETATPHVLGGLVHTAPPYRASIEQDSEGITLIFEAPAPVVPAVAAPPKEAQNDTGQPDAGSTSTRPADEQAGSPTSESPPAPPPSREEIVHVVARGDTLWDIAKRYVDNPWRYPELAENSDIHDPDLIYPGDRVRIIIYRGRRP
ncbi:MAG: chemotaxis protein CheW [Pseudomonadota bacterium]|nr:chemotaxis protein CheW [Pseudomonadota bacterium]